MAYWNHRIMRRVYDYGDGEPEIIDGIYEVYYRDNGSIINWTNDPVAPTFNVDVDDGVGIADTLNRFLRACDLPILDWETGKEIE